MWVFCGYIISTGGELEKKDEDEEEELGRGMKNQFSFNRDRDMRGKDELGWNTSHSKQGTLGINHRSIQPPARHTPILPKP